MTRHEALCGGEIRLETIFGMDAVINPDGAFVESLRAGDRDLIFPRPEIAGKNRGGIPICAPVFGPAESLGLNQHGFARDLPWEVTHVEKAGAVMKLEIDKDRCDQYGIPQNYSGLYMESSFMIGGYSATSHWINIVLKIINNGNDSMVIAPGLHPYFPINSGGTAEAVFVGDGKTEKTYNQHSLRTAVSDMDYSRRAQIVIPNNGGDSREVIIESSDLMKYVVWTDSPDKFICVEPTLDGPVVATRSAESLRESYSLAPDGSRNYATKITWQK